MNSEKLQSLLAQVKKGFSLPQAFYTSQEIFDLDLKNIYFKFWLYAGHASQLSNVGDYFTFEIGNESIIIIRDAEGKIQAFYNVCSHRGSRICTENQGNKRGLACPYHQWTFNLKGELIHARMMGEEFDKEPFSLKRVSIEVMEDLIFICLADTPPDFECMRRDIQPQLKPVGMNRVKMIYSESYDVKANSKLITENFRECYHCNVGHPEYIRAVEGIHKFDAEHVEQCQLHWQSLGLVDNAIPFTEDTWHHCQRYPFHRGYVTESLDGKPVSTLLGDYTETDMGTFCIVTYPNFWFESSSDHAITMQHTPISPTVTRIKMSWFVHQDAKEGIDFTVENVIAFWKKTGEQDWKLCEDNQAGVNSQIYKPGPYGAAEPELPKYQAWYLKQISPVH